MASASVTRAEGTVLFQTHIGAPRIDYRPTGRLKEKFYQISKKCVAAVKHVLNRHETPTYISRRKVKDITPRLGAQWKEASRLGAL